MDSNNKTNILKYKKSDAQFAYEDDNIIQPIKDRIPKANSGRTHSIKLPKYISFVIQETTRTL